MKSKHAARSIKSIAVRSNGAVFDVTFTNNWFEIIVQHDSPRRWAACQRLINAGTFSQFGSGKDGRDYVLTPAPIVTTVPTLAESFALAAVQGFKELDSSSVSSFESQASECERVVWISAKLRLLSPLKSDEMVRNYSRRAILYRFYARSLIKGYADYDAILAAYEGIEL